jgi:PII-like signaling protein
MAVQITLYLNESDEYQRKPLYLAVLNYLREQNVAGAVAFHCVAGFNGRMRVKTASLVDAGGKLPIVVVFVDTDEHIGRVLPKLQEMASHRLIVRENVQVVEGLES